MRVWLTETLTADAGVKAIFGDPARLYQDSSVEDIPEQVPFLVYHVGIVSQALRGGDPLDPAPKSRFIQVWAHDRGGDYQRIDSGLDVVQFVLENAPHEGSFLEARWIERSRDLRDPDMNTITRYDRYTLTTSR